MNNLPFDIYYHILQFNKLKYFTIMSEIIGFDINDITGSYDIIVHNTHDFFQHDDKKIHFRHLIFRNVLTHEDGDILSKYNNISGDKITLVFETRKNIVNMAIFLKCFKKCIVQINANRHLIILNVICNLFSRDFETHHDYYIEIQFNLARVKCVDFNYSIGRIHHLIFNNCFPMNKDEIDYISSSCDQLTFIVSN